jgi:hypothetical protein
MGIRDPPTSFRSRWQNGHVERLIESTRRVRNMIVFDNSKKSSCFAPVRYSVATGGRKEHQRGIAEHPFELVMADVTDGCRH